MPENIPTKLIIGLVVAAAIGVGVYFWLGTGDAGSMSLQTNNNQSNATETVDAIGTSEVLAQLNRLQNININTNIYQSDIYLSLEDFGISITEQPIGRENPFISPASNIQGGIIFPSPTQPTQQSVSSNEEDEEVATSTEEGEGDQQELTGSEGSTSSETTVEIEEDTDE
ncbi:MAG: hypothetical protein WD335_00935 [Candidatus Paceibacterota bacterium]